MALVLAPVGAPLGFLRSPGRRRFGAVSSAIRTENNVAATAKLDWDCLLKTSYRSAMHLALPLLLYSCCPEAVPAEEAPGVIASELGASSAVVKTVPSVPQCEALCEESYGFLPCSVNVGGSLFLMVTYGFFLLLAARFISQGSELLLEVMNPGLIGGLLLPVLGALPDALLVLASGLGGTVEEAQRQVMVGVGVLAGSTTLLLTIAWAGSLWVGRCDLSEVDGTAKEGELSKKYELLETGVTTDSQTRWGAYIMMFSTVPLLCAQVPLLDGHPAEGPEAALVGSLVSFMGLFAYCSYQVLFPWFQRKRIEKARLKFLKTRVLQKVSSYASGSSTRKDLGREKLESVFKCFDKNGDGKIEEDELKGFIVGLGIEGEGYSLSRDVVDTWLREFDVDASNTIAEHEFVEGLNKWAAEVSKAKQLQRLQQLESYEPSFWAARSEEAKQVLELLEQDIDDVDEDDESGSSSSGLYVQAVLYLASGAALAALFADPLVNSIEGFSKATQVPPFFIAFVVTPLASNASELFSSITFAMKKRKRNISLTFSQIYGAVTMNNTLCLGIFLALVYTRALTWDFSSEVTAILITTFFVGILGASRASFPTWFSIPVVAMYPLSIAGITFLDNYLGWH